MAWTRVQDPLVAADSGAVATNPIRSAAPAVASTAGNTILVIVFGFSLSGAAITVTDSAGNTYQVDKQTLVASAASVALCSAHNAAAIATGTGWVQVGITGAGSTQFWGFLAFEFAPPTKPGSFDVGAAGAQGNLQTPSSGATPNVAGGQELVFEAACFQQSTGGTPSAAGPWTITTDRQVAGSNPNGVGAWQSVIGSGSYTGNALTWSVAVGSSVAVVAVYKTPVTGGLRVPNLPTLATMPTIGGF